MAEDENHPTGFKSIAILREPSSAHLSLRFMVLSQNSDQNEFDKTAAKVLYFHRKFDDKHVGRLPFNPACVG